MIFFADLYFHFFKAHSVIAGEKVCVSWWQLDVTVDLILHTEATLVFFHKCQPRLCLLLYFYFILFFSQLVSAGALLCALSILAEGLRPDNALETSLGRHEKSTQEEAGRGTDTRG